MVPAGGWQLPGPALVEEVEMSRRDWTLGVLVSPAAGFSSRLPPCLPLESVLHLTAELQAMY